MSRSRSPDAVSTAPSSASATAATSKPVMPFIAKLPFYPLRKRSKCSETELHDAGREPEHHGDERIAVESWTLGRVLAHLDASGGELVDLGFGAEDGVLVVGGVEPSARAFDDRLPQSVGRDLTLFEIESGSNHVHRNLVSLHSGDDFLDRLALDVFFLVAAVGKHHHGVARGIDEVK